MSDKKRPSAWYAVPFFAVLAVLTVVAFIIPLRPTRSQTEKRNLAQLPTLSAEAVLSGTYFDDLSTWFSDTFPGREGWIQLSKNVEQLHGYSDMAFGGQLPQTEQLATIPDAPTAPVTLPTYVPEETQETIVIQEVTAPTEDAEEWGGIDAGEDQNIIYGNSMIQIGDSAFGFCGFSKEGCDQYSNMTNTMAAALAGTGARLVSMPIPTAIGIMVEKQYQEKLHCAPQDDIIDYIFAGLHESVIKVDLYPTLVAHNDEYIYFRTDHHWTARGAYYAYAELSRVLGYEAKPLESFKEWDMGIFQGSSYTSAPYRNKLRNDTLVAYVPSGDVRMLICPDGRTGYEWPMLMEKSHRAYNTKYMAFLSGDHALCILTNNSLPDGPNCVIVKDSYGNCLAPFLTENYHNVYVVDYRKYNALGMRALVEQYDIDDVILANNLNGAQAVGTSKQMLGLAK